jgi:hypothetical protein
VTVLADFTLFGAEEGLPAGFELDRKNLKTTIARTTAASTNKIFINIPRLGDYPALCLLLSYSNGAFLQSLSKK